MDAGFFDEENFRLCDELGIAFIGTGKTFKAIKQPVAAIGEKEWNVYDNGRQKWSYAGFEYRCDRTEVATGSKERKDGCFRLWGRRSWNDVENLAVARTK